MGKYYIYCNNNQVYHALMHNSIMCRALKVGDFAMPSLSFMSSNAIFATQEKVDHELLNLGASDIYYPVILEIDDGSAGSGESPIAAQKISIDNGEISLSNELIPLNRCESDNSCIGAFIYGEIPICYLNAILFTSDEDLHFFMRSSPDLWFPQNLFMRTNEDIQNSRLSLELISSAAAKADSFLTSENAASMLETVMRRDKEKASAYYLIKATENWYYNGIKANLDNAVIRLLDGKGQALRTIAQRTASSALTEASTDDISAFLTECDRYSGTKQETFRQALLKQIEDCLCAQKTSSSVDRELFRLIADKCIEAIPADDKSKAELNTAFEAIDRYIYQRTEYDREATLNKLEKYPVLQALFSFLDQSDDIDSLNRVCYGRPQEERRYAYMMFGWYHGMAPLSGTIKSNRQLERRLSDITVSQYKNDFLVSTAGGSQEFCSPDVENSTSVYGITPQFSIWYDCKSSYNLLKETAEKSFEDICKKICPDALSEKIYKAGKPIVITIRMAEKEQHFELCRAEDIKSSINSIKKLLSNYFEKEKTFDAAAGRKFYSSNQGYQSYQRYFERHSDEIQLLCKEVKK